MAEHDYPKQCREAAAEFRRCAAELLGDDPILRPGKIGFETVAQDYETVATVIEALQSKLDSCEERFQAARDAFDAKNIDKLLEAISGVRFEKPDAATLEWARREIERITK
jgi:hypothetical protein